MNDKELIIKSLEERKVEVKEEMEYKDSQMLADELYEIDDTLKKLGVNVS